MCVNHFVDPDAPQHETSSKKRKQNNDTTSGMYIATCVYHTVLEDCMYLS